MATPSFLRVIRLNTRGEDVLFAKRCLAHAGHGGLTSLTQLFGSYAVTHLKNFQKQKGLLGDGQVGPVTFRALLATADSRALWHLENARRKLTAPPPPAFVKGEILLPQFFRATHQTGGLPGFPAIDVFGKPFTSVGAPEDATVTRLAGKSPSLGGPPGGAYGWTIYLKGVSGSTYFLTHFAYRSVVTGQRVKWGQKIGGICDTKVAHMDTRLSHIHVGKRNW